MRLLTGLFLMALSFLTTPSSASELAKLTGLDGIIYEAFAAGPENSKTGILLFHDWLGLSEATRTSATRLAQDGARVIAIELYQAQTASNHNY